MGRLAVTIIFFCIIMSVCAILDTYIALFDLFTIDTSDFLCRLMRPLFFALLYLLIRAADAGGGDLPLPAGYGSSFWACPSCPCAR